MDRDEVRRIARLAHLEYPRVRDDRGAWAEPEEHLIDDQTLDRLARDMDQILGYVRQLEEVDVSNVAPTSHGVDLPPNMREDAVEEGADPEALLQGAPARAEDAVSVPKIVE